MIEGIKSRIYSMLAQFAHKPSWLYEDDLTEVYNEFEALCYEMYQMNLINETERVGLVHYAQAVVTEVRSTLRD